MPQSTPAARRQLEFIKRQGGLVVVVTAAALVAAAATTFTQHKVYRASTKIVVGQGGGIFPPQFGNAVQPATQTMSSLLKSDIVATTVIRDLRLKGTTQELLHHLSVSSTPDNSVLQVSYDSSNRGESVRILNKVSSVFTSLVRRKLGRQQVPKGSAAVPVITATVFDPAHADPNPISPRPARTLLFSGIIGLVLGIVLALLRDTLDERMRSREEIEEHFGAPIIAAIPKNMLGRRAIENAHVSVPSFIHAIEPLRRKISRGHALERLIVITSGGAGAGKSAVAANLSVALAVAGEDVICVGADSNGQGLAAYFDLTQDDASTTSSLSGLADLPKALRDVRIEGGLGRREGIDDDVYDPAGETNGRKRGMTGRVRLLVWSPQEGAGNELVAHTSIDDLVINLLEVEHGYVVVDAPPLPSGTTFALLSVANEAIIVASEDKTTKKQATFIRETLERLQLESYGVVTVRRTSKSVAM
jgi:capsular polysaccharide biosynthesis protein/MinD-like ATPase involved in chromosome partitioning or flagellar assembly